MKERKHTFDSLVNGREFDMYQPGLISRWRAQRLGYSLTYSEQSGKSFMLLDYSSESLLGQVVLWSSGECELEAKDKITSEQVFFEKYQFNNTDEFFSTYVRLPLFLKGCLEE